MAAVQRVAEIEVEQVAQQHPADHLVGNDQLAALGGWVDVGVRAVS
jgi:hypothetical protein